MTLYRLVGQETEWDARGLTLEEAFAGMMAWAGTDYIFSRLGGVMLLSFIETRSISDGALLDPERMGEREKLRARCPIYYSNKLDDGDARRELMLQALTSNRTGYRIREEDRPFLVPIQGQSMIASVSR